MYGFTGFYCQMVVVIYFAINKFRKFFPNIFSDIIFRAHSQQFFSSLVYISEIPVPVQPYKAICYAFENGIKLLGLLLNGVVRTQYGGDVLRDRLYTFHLAIK